MFINEAVSTVYGDNVINKEKEVLIGSSELIMVYIHKFLPKLFYKLARTINCSSSIFG